MKFVVYHVASTMEKKAFKSAGVAMAVAEKMNVAAGKPEYAAASEPYYVAHVVKMVEKTNLMGGKYLEASNTPALPEPRVRNLLVDVTARPGNSPGLYPLGAAAMNSFLVTYLPWHVTFVAELARKGCKKINYYALPATGRELDVKVAPREVPLEVRRAAKLALLASCPPLTPLDL